MQAARLQTRLKDPGYRADRTSHGQDDGSGSRSSHNIPVAADYVRARRAEQRHRRRPGQGHASQLRVGAVPRPAGAQPQGGVAAARAIRQQCRTVNIGVVYVHSSINC